MKVTLTSKEIISKLGLPADTELVIELGQDQDDDSIKWISNVGRDTYGHPDSLSDGAEIEVKFRTGETDTGRASDWYICWNETDNGSSWDIVAYRVL